MSKSGLLRALFDRCVSPFSSWLRRTRLRAQVREVDQSIVTVAKITAHHLITRYSIVLENTSRELALMAANGELAEYVQVHFLEYHDQLTELFACNEPPSGKWRTPPQTAVDLAWAVTSDLFGVRWFRRMARERLLAKNGALVGSLIEGHLRALRGEPHIREMVSVLAHTKFSTAAATGTVTPETLLWIVKLRDLGILLPAAEISLPSSPNELREQIQEFERWSLRSR